MWIHNTNILLKVTFEHQIAGQNLSVDLLDQNLNQVKFTNLSRLDSNIQTVSTKISMPNNVYLVIDNHMFSPVKVVDVSLGNIPFEEHLISESFEYKMNYEQKDYSIKQLLDLGSHKTNMLEYSGVMCFNFFDTNPIAYHMHLGNIISACKHTR